MTPRQVSGGDAYAIYLHGGAYVLGDARDAVAVLMADELEIPLVSIQYSLAPEAPFPAALDDAVAAYSAIVAQRSSKFVLLGVSAGTGTDASHARTRTSRTVGAGIDKTVDRSRPRRHQSSQPRRTRPAHQVARAARHSGPRLCGWNKPGRSVAFTGVFHELRGFPPSMITTGTRDLFLSNCVRMYWALRAAEAPSHLRVWEGMWHSFCGEPDIPEAAECRREIATFLRKTLDSDIVD
ncbi:alpha/beta hydrolase [Nocardia amamiensis]|uniref:alpha/beta hydrolase n=1 Tax=Nocardia amamiensis TaxID=404578 RepID=UPI0033E39E7D